jgi:hypothetical protein
MKSVIEWQPQISVESEEQIPEYPPDLERACVCDVGTGDYTVVWNPILKEWAKILPPYIPILPKKFKDLRHNGWYIYLYNIDLESTFNSLYGTRDADCFFYEKTAEGMRSPTGHLCDDEDFKEDDLFIGPIDLERKE